MFHCNGWCFTWAVTAAGGTHICLPRFDAGLVWRLLQEQSITHLSAAPTVLTMLADTAPRGLISESPILVQTGGSPPSPSLLAGLASRNMEVTHLYGLTETFGPLAINDWLPEWSRLSGPEQARLKARQGVGNVISQALRVVTQDGEDVAANGEMVGELICRGNNVMLGYYADPEATASATLDGWLRTGDLAVMYPDGYVEIRDRAKDIIISGGENIASVEVERTLDAHPAVLESAVVATPSPRWGEIPIAFVTIRAGMHVTADELIAHVRARIAHFKVPKAVVFTELPKTSTGKIMKTDLRERAKGVRTPDPATPTTVRPGREATSDVRATNEE
jgi:fatty-acyl-CoA synthase